MKNNPLSSVTVRFLKNGICMALGASLLNACGGNDGGVNDSADVTGPGGTPIATTDCGPVILRKQFNSISSFSSETRRYNANTGDYGWPGLSASIGVDASKNGGGRSGVLEAQEGVDDGACVALDDAFGSNFSMNIWSGDANEEAAGIAFPEFLADGSFYSPIAELRLEFAINEFETIEQWKAAGEPDTGRATLSHAALDVWYGTTSGTVRTLAPQIEDQNGPVTFDCDDDFQTQYRLQIRETLDASVDPLACEYDQGAEVYMCLSAFIENDFEGCTVSTERLLVPDANAEFFEVSISGSFSANDRDGLMLTTTRIDVL